MEFLFLPATWLSLLTLTLLEVILGIDNLVFLTVAISRLPQKTREQARKIGLMLACLMRLILLALLFQLTKFQTGILVFLNQSYSLRDLIFLMGGLFLIIKSITDIHSSLMPQVDNAHGVAPRTFIMVLLQITIFDLVFSLDSLITAIGIAQYYSIMAVAIVIAILLMYVASRSLSRLIHRYPTIKILALNFILLIGVVLIADGLHFHIPRGYIYFAMSFALFVEVINIVLRRNTHCN